MKIEIDLNLSEMFLIDTLTTFYETHYLDWVEKFSDRKSVV
jgi:hypothetical protein